MASTLLSDLFTGRRAVLALAPMQDVTDRTFWNLISRYGGADIYFTEYFRVHPTSRLEKTILQSILHNPTGRPVVAQMIGNDVPALVRTARELQRYPIAAVDLNLGCPAPVVYRKQAGGGLLREPERVDRILGALREAIGIPFTVKTRLGFDSPQEWETLLPIFARHSLDLLSIHGRTIRQMYRGEVHYAPIARAAIEMPCPVLANGNIDSADKARDILDFTHARGLMMGRGAIRNPWLFSQIRQCLAGRTISRPTGEQVLGYIRDLFYALQAPHRQSRGHIEKMKKYLNYIGQGVEPSGRFLYQIRRVTSEAEFFRVCSDFLEHDQPMLLEPFPLPAGKAETSLPSA